MSYNHKSKDSQWQKTWEEQQSFKAVDFSEKPKYYALDMFPYPSGAGLHVGHMAAYTPTDVISRYKRHKGFNVLHPIGYDAFGLPAEQYAIKTGVHPEETTKKSIETFRRQLKSFGMSFDWSREISTCDSSFYKWTQFIFAELHKKGLAYEKEAPVNWCPALKTVLANEEVVDGKSERGGHPVIRKPMKQWMLKITDYSEKLLAGLDDINWPDRTREGQKNWIGKSQGAEVKFAVQGHESSLTVFTTRPDTLFGATFMVVSPEHPLLASAVPTNFSKAVSDYQENASKKSEIERKSLTDKDGVFTGLYATNPVNQKLIPIWTSDYVLMDYGTGAIMAVPAHDERDFEFATKYELEIVRVLDTKNDLPDAGDGQLINSDFLDGLKKHEAIKKMVSYLEEKSLGNGTTQYKLRDWLFSRQRYWGEPFPILHSKDGQTTMEVPLAELPVILPETPNYEPSEDGQAPLSNCTDWVNYSDEFKRETDTMPGSAGSSWYFLRYIDPTNNNFFADKKLQEYWMPVDLYVGGPEHTVGHLLYSRFWQRFLFEQGLTTCPEPFKKLAHQGMILGMDGEKMSKSRGNVINPDDVREEYGADTLRCFILFLGPLDRDKPWSTTGIHGVKKFLDRAWRLFIDDSGKPKEFTALDASLEKTLHKSIKKVGEDIENLDFNTAISALMILLNDAYKASGLSIEFVKSFTTLLSPFAPHMCEEIWSIYKFDGLASLSQWPDYDESLIVDNTVTIGVQVNGKKRGAIEIAPAADQATALKMANEIAAVQAAIGESQIRKVIYVPGKILNIIAK